MVMMGLKLTGKLPFKEVGVFLLLLFFKYVFSILYILFLASGAAKLYV